MAETHRVIAAFADGERVNPDELKHALSTDEGREYFVELLVLRDLVHVSDPDMEIGTRTSRRDRRTWLAIAAALVVSVLGGYAVGLRTHEPEQASDSPALTAPAPTRVIHLEPGVNWKESSGG